MAKALILTLSYDPCLVEFTAFLASLGYEIAVMDGCGATFDEPPINSRGRIRQEDLLSDLLKRLKQSSPPQFGDEGGSRRVDVIVLCPLPPKTRGMIGCSQGQSGPDKAFWPTIAAVVAAAVESLEIPYLVTDPGDYVTATQVLSADISQADTLKLRRQWAAKALALLAQRSLEYAQILSTPPVPEREAAGPARLADALLGGVSGIALLQRQKLRYGENPHQRAALYSICGSPGPNWEQLSGKELSYNNLLDFSAALRIVRSFDSQEPLAVIVKHLNPCGAARAETLLSALRRSKRSDPRSHFGGIVALNSNVSQEVALEVISDFCEIVVAPSYSDDALEILRSRKNLRVIKAPITPFDGGVDMRFIEGGVLIQEGYRPPSPVFLARLVSSRPPTSSEMRDLEFAWTLCSHVRSNAIVIVKDEAVVGVGAGQMSRIDAVEVALLKAKSHGHDLRGAATASDAYFPFADSITTLARAGISAVVAEGGSRRDSESIVAADAAGMAYYMSSERHFTM